jgi:hypothetical protein
LRDQIKNKKCPIYTKKRQKVFHKTDIVFWCNWLTQTIIYRYLHEILTKCLYQRLKYMNDISQIFWLFLLSFRKMFSIFVDKKFSFIKHKTIIRFYFIRQLHVRLHKFFKCQLKNFKYSSYYFFYKRLLLEFWQFSSKLQKWICKLFSS